MPPLAAATSAIDDDLAVLLERTDSRPIAIEPVQSSVSPRAEPGAFRVRLADGRCIKARVQTSRGHAERIEYFLGRLHHEGFPKVLARHGRALLLEWFDGEPLPDRPPAELLERCASLHASVHLVPAPEDCPYGIRDVASFETKLESELRELCDLGIVAEPVGRTALQAAERFRPDGCAIGIVHRDICSENLIVRPGGAVAAIDNESLSLGAREFDLARTWYRWPMERARRRIYLEAYTRVVGGGIDPFLAHFPFWAIAVLADSARLRAGATPQVSRVPVERLSELLAVLQRGVPGAESVFEA